MDNIFKVNPKDKTILKKENGVVRKEKATEEEMIKIKEATTLCFDCSNLSNCKKVDDKIKLSIDNYDFISDGAQIIDKHGDIESFEVSKCKDFIREKDRDNSGPPSIEARRKLMMDYFGVNTIEEANELASKLEAKEDYSPKRR